ncbi:helix-turn-helix domain-containing protein [Roseibium sediminis]|uniref:helix-turn-helix domain-containing protein n=1 Tax=Roseibium sediminis TaxID=1775174 RepID=UPI00123D0238|nr:LexA family transcriptional regulator [Roseibium sediminis]
MQDKNTILDLDIDLRAYYQCGMSILKEKRLAKGLTQAGLADLIGTSQPQIRRLETGERQLTPDWAKRLAPHLGIEPAHLLFPDDQSGTDNQGHKTNAAGDTEINVFSSLSSPQPLLIQGEVAAGHWLEADLFEGAEPEQSMIVGGDKRFPLPYQYLLRIKGESMNKIAQDGDLVLCVDYMQAGIDLKNNDIVIVERSRDGGLTIERTAKRAVRKNGSIELRPESTDPRFQEPVIYNDHDNDTTEVRVIAKVICVINML